jgi:hypothetical protein
MLTYVLIFSLTTLPIQLFSSDSDSEPNFPTPIFSRNHSPKPCHHRRMSSIGSVVDVDNTQYPGRSKNATPPPRNRTVTRNSTELTRNTPLRRATTTPTPQMQQPRTTQDTTTARFEMDEVCCCCGVIIASMVGILGITYGIPATSN